MASSSLRNSLKRQDMCNMSWLLRWRDFCCFTWSSCCWNSHGGRSRLPGSLLFEGRRIPQDNALHEWIHQFLGAAQLVFWGQVVCRDTFQQWSFSYEIDVQTQNPPTISSLMPQHSKISTSGSHCYILHCVSLCVFQMCLFQGGGSCLGWLLFWGFQPVAVEPSWAIIASLQVAGVDCTSSVETKMVRSLLLGGTAIWWITVETVDVGKTSHLESPLADYGVISSNIIIHDDYGHEPSSIDHPYHHRHCHERPNVKWTSWHHRFILRFLDHCYYESLFCFTGSNSGCRVLQPHRGTQQVGYQVFQPWNHVKPMGDKWATAAKLMFLAQIMCDHRNMFIYTLTFYTL